MISGDAEWKLPKADDEKFIAKMKEVEASWQKYKKEDLSKAKDNPALLKDFYAESESFLKLAEESTIAAASIYEGKVRDFKVITVILLVLNLIVFAFGWIMIGKKIVKPLAYLPEQMAEIASGNLKVALEASGKGEIAILR